jgi:hypothetical protein
MDVKEAVVAAKQYIGEIFGAEGIRNLGLEEVEFDEPANEWRVTIGFSRPWDAAGPVSVMFTPSRSYKVVRISDKSGKVVSVKNREVAA